MSSTYIIRHVKTKEQWKSSSGKTSWNKPGHAKSAFKGGAQESDGDIVYARTSWVEK